MDKKTVTREYSDTISLADILKLPDGTRLLSDRTSGPNSVRPFPFQMISYELKPYGNGRGTAFFFNVGITVADHQKIMMPVEHAERLGLLSADGKSLVATEISFDGHNWLWKLNGVEQSSAAPLGVSPPATVTDVVLPCSIPSTPNQIGQEQARLVRRRTFVHDTPDETRAKEISDKGEAFVELHLNTAKPVTQGYRLRKLNHDDRIGVGSDFQLFLNDALVEEVEVKTTTSNNPSTPFKLSAAQLRKAIESGDRYVIYLVLDVEGSNRRIVRIANPLAQLLHASLESGDLLLALPISG